MQQPSRSPRESTLNPYHYCPSCRHVVRCTRVAASTWVVCHHCSHLYQQQKAAR